jgi:hypothetical protein
LAKQPAKYVTGLGAQDEVDWEIVGQTSSSNTVIVDAIYDELPHPLIDERLELNPQCLHHASRVFNERKVCPAYFVTSRPDPQISDLHGTGCHFDYSAAL